MHRKDFQCGFEKANLDDTRAGDATEDDPSEVEADHGGLGESHKWLRTNRIFIPWLPLTL